jgi:hypothetical protein
MCYKLFLEKSKIGSEKRNLCVIIILRERDDFGIGLYQPNHTTSNRIIHYLKMESILNQESVTSNLK